MVWQPIDMRQASDTIRRVWPLLVIRGVLMAAFGLATLGLAGADGHRAHRRVRRLRRSSTVS